MGNPQDRSLQLYGTIPGTEVLYMLLRLLPVTEVPLWCWEKNSLCENLYFSPHISKSYLRVLICCWFCHVCFQHSWAGCFQGIMDLAFMAPFHPKFPFKGARSGWQVPDSLATAFPLEAQSKTEFHTRNCYMLCEISQLKQEIINFIWSMA
jgi:hypothetical protein